jgi:hypothetical protein
MSNPCYGTGDVGDYAPFPAFGENMDPTNQAVSLLENTLIICSDNKQKKRIILDEIHTIGQDDSGTVWEQIILLAPCPIVYVTRSP